MITAVVLAKNEEENIEKCLNTLRWCDEVIVIDDESSDKTAKIAQNQGAKVYKRALNGDFAAQRNFGLEKARGEWVLFVDADEQVTPQLRAEIQKGIKGKFVGFYLKRKDFVFGRFLKYGETGKIKLLRLGKRGMGNWQGKVHETWEIQGPVGELENPLEHFPHPTISEFLKDINFYSTLRARQLYEENVKTNLFQIIFFPVGKFAQNFFLKLGFLDKTPGFMVAILMSFHSFLVRSKLYLLWKKEAGWRE